MSVAVRPAAALPWAALALLAVARPGAAGPPSAPFVHEARLSPQGEPIGDRFGQFGRAIAVSGDDAVVGGAGTARILRRSGRSWSEAQTLKPSVLAGDFGRSVAISGGTLVVGAPDLSSSDPLPGAAFVFVRVGSVWVESQVLVEGAGVPGDQFARSVVLAGDTLMIGAPGDDGGYGAVHVYGREGSTWTFRQKLLAPGPGSLLGLSLAVSGDTAIAGAYYRAFVYSRSGSTWSERQVLTPSGALGQHRFGDAVALSGDRAVVGAPTENGMNFGGYGAVFAFERRSPSASWVQTQKISAPDPGDSYQWFGSALLVSEDELLVGTPYADAGSDVETGAVYTYARSGGAWVEDGVIDASPPAYFDGFGSALARSEGVLLVGGPGASEPRSPGAVFVFERPLAEWTLTQRLNAIDGSFDWFGVSVDLDGDRMVVGAYEDDLPGGANAGSAYVWRRSGASWSLEQKLVAADALEDDSLGTSVSISGDTVATGAARDDTVAGVDAGSVRVFLWTGTVWAQQAMLTAPDGAGEDRFGNSVALAGDVLAVGAPIKDTHTGAVYVFVRTGGAWSLQQKLVASDGALGDHFGESVALVGDDLVVGAPFDDAPQGDEAGSAYVFTRTGSTWTETQKLTAPDAGFSAWFGRVVRLSGDLIAVEAPVHLHGGGGARGGVYVFARNGGTWTFEEELLPPPGLERMFGSSLDGNVIASSGVDQDASTAVPVFERVGTAWELRQVVQPPEGSSFGSTAVSAATLAVTNVEFPGTILGNSGVVHAYHRASSTDVAIGKTDGQASAIPGLPVTYSIVVSNAGPNPGVGVRVLDQPPPALTEVTWSCSSSTGSSCPPAGVDTIDHTANVDVGGTLTYTLSATIAPSAAGSLVNQATVALAEDLPDPVPGNNTAIDTDALTPEADLGLALLDAPDPVISGATLTYTAEVANAGPSDSSGASFSAALAPQAVVTSVQPGAPTCTHTASAVDCTFGATASASSRTVVIQAAIAPGALGTIQATAAIDGADPDPASANDNAAAETQMVAPPRAGLSHGSSLWADLRSPGGLADEDRYRIDQGPLASYEVVVDGTSGDFGGAIGFQVDRLAGDGATTLQGSTHVGVGPSRSLRWQNYSLDPVTDQYVRVRSTECASDCGPDDVYRVRLRETTLSGARFNNAGTQVTVLLIQNLDTQPVFGAVYFWDVSGARIGSHTFLLPAKASLVLNTATVAGVAGVGGSLTVAHDAPYGLLVGKAVALEPGTGFAFDTPLVPRPR